MKTRNTLALILILISFVTLIPGLYLNIVTLNAGMTIPFTGQDVELFNDSRSIIGTIEGLHESGNDFVAGLILLFSVVVPFIKGGMLALAMALRGGVLRYRLFAFVKAISKWAMNDVFVVGIYVAYMSAKATDNLDATIEPGFYWFTAYCLLSLIALQVMQLPAEKPKTKATS